MKFEKASDGESKKTSSSSEVVSSDSKSSAAASSSKESSSAPNANVQGDVVQDPEDEDEDQEYSEALDDLNESQVEILKMLLEEKIKLKDLEEEEAKTKSDKSANKMESFVLLNDDEVDSRQGEPPDGTT